jgi:hypothetical protein
MNTADAAPSPLAPRRQWLSPSVIRGVWFWERGRLAYNGVQLLLTGFMVVVRWPESHFLYTTNLRGFFGYVVIANVLYSLAYLPEAVLQIPSLRPYARQTRWVILIAGTAFACLLAAIALDIELLRDPADD